MNEIVKAIEAKDWHSLQMAVFGLANSYTISIRELCEILEILPSIVVAFPEQTILKDKGEQITWYRYETLIWQIGESFRQILKRKKEFRKDSTLLYAIQKICLDIQFGKGRESFVMLLGQYGDQRVVGTFVQLLNDLQVQGHAIYALRLHGTPEVQESIRPFLQSSKTWIRNEAKKYFQKITKQALQA